jgi:hypothetical protein
LGVLTRLQYLGFVWVSEGDARREVLVTSSDHYALMPDVQGPTGRVFPNKAVRVVSEFLVCLPGYEAAANDNAMFICRKCVSDMIYESCVSQNMVWKAQRHEKV